jgi:hypothetical protein
MSEVDQVATENVGASYFLGHPEFQRGFDDVRAGRPPFFDRAGQHRRDRIDSQWAYERGRQFGIIAPRGMQLQKRAGSISTRCACSSPPRERGKLSDGQAGHQSHP